MSHKNISLHSIVYEIPEGTELMDVAVYVKNNFDKKGSEIAEISTFEDGSISIEIRSDSSTTEKVLCTESRIKARLHIDEEHRLVLRLSGGKWLDKLIGLGITSVYPLMALPTVPSIILQIMLPIEVVRCIDKYIEEKNSAAIEAEQTA